VLGRRERVRDPGLARWHLRKMRQFAVRRPSRPKPTGSQCSSARVDSSKLCAIGLAFNLKYANLPGVCRELGIAAIST
jgi:hypothetical protein